ncbi:MAG: ABC transporter ATP-binding protein [Clostridia bacterium]|nr:ABC transporter ATP-binding protein [Clostridia bacterium]
MSFLGDVAPPERPSQRFSYREDEPIERPFDARQLLRLLGYLRPYRAAVLVALAATVAGSLTRLFLPLLLGLAIDRAIRPGDLARLDAYALAYLALQLAYWALSHVRIRLTNRVGQYALRDLRRELFAHVERLSFEFFDGRPAGRILVRITNDVNALNDLMTNGVVNTLGDALTLLGILVVTFSIEPRLALVAVVVVPAMFLISTRLRLVIRRAWQAVRVRLATLNAHLAEAIQGMRVTQAFVQEAENALFFANLNFANYRAYMRAVRSNAHFAPLVELTGAVGTALVFVYGVALVVAGQLTVGYLVSFISYMGNFWEPISRIGQVYSTLLVAMASCERIFEILDTPVRVAERPGALRPARLEGRVAFEDVHFSYEPGREEALAGVSFAVEPGTTVALVGRTGAGKTSVVNLVARFYDATAGVVRLDGKDVREYALDLLRRDVACVQQETFLFSGTVRDNIRYGRPEATDAEVERAARAVFAHEFIERLPLGYETEVRERGSRLSGGQRQLLSFARAVLADPAILILDEATSAIDTETEALIQEALAALLRGRTSFVIAHRLSTIRRADLILVLDKGRIVERGDHAALLRAGGVYSRLVRAQEQFLAGTAG